MRLILRNLGYVLIISAFFRIPPFIAALIFKENVLLLTLSTIITLLGGGLLLLIRKGEEETMRLSQGFVLTALSFITLSLIGSISFMEIFNWNFANALFESVSGFTTTGLTMLKNIEALPKTLLLWRAETQWIGGLGIVMFFLFILSRLKSPTYKKEKERTQSINTLYKAQGISENFSSMRHTIFTIIKIYFIYTAAGILLLWLAKIPLFEAISIAFTSISTGGFTVTNTFYSNWLQLSIITLLMLAGATSFVFHANLFKGKIKEFFRNMERKV